MPCGQNTNNQSKTRSIESLKEKKRVDWKPFSPHVAGNLGIRAPEAPPSPIAIVSLTVKTTMSAHPRIPCYRVGWAPITAQLSRVLAVKLAYALPWKARRYSVLEFWTQEGLWNSPCPTCAREERIPPQVNRIDTTKPGFRSWFGETFLVIHLH